MNNYRLGFELGFVKKAGFWTEALGAGVSTGALSALGNAVHPGLGGALGGISTLVPALTALLSKTRTTEEQANKGSGILENFIPGVGWHNAWKRTGYGIRNPDLKAEEDKVKEQGYRKGGFEWTQGQADANEKNKKEKK